MEGWQSLVECTGLENRQVSNGLVGSNPTPSAKKFIKKKVFIIFRNKRIFFYENLFLKSLILLLQRITIYIK